MPRANDPPVKTVAARAGFSSRSYFSRAFKAFTGVGPATYRANAITEAARSAGADGADVRVRAEDVRDG